MSTHALPSRVDGDEVRRVRLRPARRRARRRARAPLRRREPAQRGSRASARGTPESPPRVSTRGRPRELDRLAPDALVRGEIVARSAARRARRRARAATRRSCPCTPRGALRGERLERGDEPGLLEPCRPARAACPPGAYMRAPSRIVITGSSIARHAACAGGISTPSRASRIAGSTSARPRQAPVRRATARRGPRARPAPHTTPARSRSARAPRRTAPRDARARSPPRPSPAPRRSSRGCCDAARRRVPVDRVPAAEQPGHDRLGDARRERCRNRCVRGAAAVARGSRRPPRRSPDGPRQRRRSRARAAGVRSSRCARRPARGKSIRWPISAAGDPRAAAERIPERSDRRAARPDRSRAP